jgi:hypothetical protein
MPFGFLLSEFPERFFLGLGFGSSILKLLGTDHVEVEVIRKASI